MRSWPGNREYYDCADANVLTVAVVEEACALGRIDEIAATPGIDVLFIGTSDLSFSLGLRGRQDHPELDDAIARIANAARRHNKYLGRPLRNPSLLPQFREQGFSIFQCPTDLDFLASGARNFLEKVAGR